MRVVVFGNAIIMLGGLWTESPEYLVVVYLEQDYEV